MTEEVLYTIWMYGWYRKDELRTPCGMDLKILKPGIRNEHSGPDFSDARIRMDGALWAGQVEIHVKSSNWNLHRHSEDEAYNNVILHVVYEHDEEVFTSAGAKLPVLELKSLLDPEKLRVSMELLENTHWLRCESRLSEVNPVRMSLWLDRLAVQRMEEKIIPLKERFEMCRNDWEECLYRTLAHAFGFRVNSPAFEMLSMYLPYKWIRKYRYSEVLLESLVFGAAGFLDTFFEDHYPRTLQNEFKYLGSKHEMECMKPEMWKFMRLRPRNFPTLRLSQWATFHREVPELLKRVLTEEDVEKVTGMFNVSASGYWKDHFHFDRKAGRIRPVLGWDSAQLILVNGIIPFLFFYGVLKGENRYRERAMKFLQSLKPENNAAIRGWRAAGIEPANALQSQALLQLKNNYCMQAKCLQCSVGIVLLNGKRSVHQR